MRERERESLRKIDIYRDIGKEIDLERLLWKDYQQEKKEKERTNIK